MLSSWTTHLIAVVCCVAVLQTDIAQSNGRGIRGVLQHTQQVQDLPQRRQPSYSRARVMSALRQKPDAQGRSYSAQQGSNQTSGRGDAPTAKPAKKAADHRTTAQKAADSPAQQGSGQTPGRE